MVSAYLMCVVLLVSLCLLFVAGLVSLFSHSKQEDNVLNGELLKQTRLSCQRINRDLITSLYGATPLLSHDGD
jgi:hypothetical protein